MSDELDRRLAAVVARKQAADNAAAAERQARAQAETDREAARRRTAAQWESQCLPMLKRRVDQVNQKLQAGQLWIGFNEAQREGPALANIELRLHIDGKPSERRGAMNVNALGKIQLRLPGSDRSIEADVNTLSEEAFGSMLADFLDAAIAAPRWEAP